MSDLLRRFSIKDSFWSYYEDLVIKEVIPYQEKVLNDLLPETPKSGAINNFRIAAQVLEEGKTNEEFYGMVFQD
ncbi:MAG TPA: glycoside hydrolase family 127 protein, partial [Lachnospiraceae bacterium]|nr:glycoside hydrolase family 127 protein [Lachnospiraceae bacterium]